MGNIIHLDVAEVKKELGELVRGTVEETLNKLLDEERIESRTRIGTSVRNNARTRKRGIIRENC